MQTGDFHHVSVLLREAVANLVTDPQGIYVDCTLGGAGHSQAILERLEPGGRLIAFDQDPAAIANAQALLGDNPQTTLIHANFARLAENLSKLGAGPVKGILFDLGVSSPQLDQAERGFSYLHDAPLDMRMDPNNPLTARTIVNDWSEQELARVIWEYGEENWARRIAELIVRERQSRLIETTGQLVALIKEAIPAPARRTGPHPAKRTFQALRIVVNDELGALGHALDQAIDCLDVGGRVAAITFHSLEDRMVKEKMQSWLGRCICPPGLPVCRCGAQAVARLITRKPLVPSPWEIEHNPRARSAKLRVAEKIQPAT